MEVIFEGTRMSHLHKLRTVVGCIPVGDESSRLCRVILNIGDMTPKQIWHQEITVVLSLSSVSTGNSQTLIHQCSLATSDGHIVSQGISSPC